MDLKLKSINELLDIALNTKCLKEILFLSDHPSMNVRRALAKNVEIDAKTLNKLINDPVQNVSYMAGLNPNNKTKRTFNELRPCVVCEEDEKTMDCVACDEIKEHSF